MWFIYSCAAMLLLVTRRSTEKTLTDKIPSSALAWLQQLTALPFMATMLLFADWYNPFSLGAQFLLLLALYAVVAAIDLIMYYKAISVGDISLVAPLLNLSSVTGIMTSFLILHQNPTIFGVSGALFIVLGAYFVMKHRSKNHSKASNNALVISLVLFLTIIRGFYSPIEVTLLQITNPIYLNFFSSLLTVPTILLIILIRTKNKSQSPFNKKLRATLRRHKLALAFIGFTMAINIFFTLTAKTTAPNAGYVTAIKGAQVVPMTFVGVLFFKEHVTKRQWAGIALIFTGLLSFMFS